MKYILAAIFLIGTTLSFPLGESNESKSGNPIINPNSLSSTKSQESDEMQKHDHDESHKDVSHEHHKDSSETSEESSESNEKPEQPSKFPEAVPIPEESKPSEEKILDEPIKKPNREAEKQKVGDVIVEKSHFEERIDILEAASKPAAIAAESAAPEEQFIKNIEDISEKKINDNPISQSDSIPEVKQVEENPLTQENSVAAEVNLPKDKVDEPIPEGKSEPLDIPLDMKKEGLKIEKPSEEMGKVDQPMEEIIEKGDTMSEKNESKKLPELNSDKSDISLSS
ncbi:hypothetical protein RI129_009236 [Pyrocoelia pectoralis]|uniref:Uncharacterized protein n=1 Tax=Pyrocoelia pectoralis TaxID=417401 RepID=A0AAN7V6F6_9COLE